MRKADNLPPYCAVVKKSRSLNILDPCGPAWPVTGVLYHYLEEKRPRGTVILKQISEKYCRLDWIRTTVRYRSAVNSVKNLRAGNLLTRQATHLLQEHPTALCWRTSGNIQAKTKARLGAGKGTRMQMVGG